MHQFRSTILLVDDDEALRDEIVELLTESGYDAFGVSNGLSAMRVLQADAIDLVVLDLNMPLMDGWELRNQIVHTPKLAAIPILIMSADPSATALGVDLDHILPKPF